jgi:hypothetical protein
MRLLPPFNPLDLIPDFAKQKEKNVEPLSKLELLVDQYGNLVFRKRRFRPRDS